MHTVLGARVCPGYLDREQQEAVLGDIRRIVGAAPLFAPMTPWGKPMRVRMTSAGRFGWFTDRKGYRYIPRHPGGGDWPAIPDSVLAIWKTLVGTPLPDACLVNYYDDKARMGLHQDKDERDFSHPVLSISLGDTARFRIGGTKRSDPTQSFDLCSGDVVVLEGPSRLAFHGIDRIKPGTSDLLRDGGRVNLTLRVVE